MEKVDDDLVYVSSTVITFAHTYACGLSTSRTLYNVLYNLVPKCVCGILLGSFQVYVVGVGACNLWFSWFDLFGDDSQWVDCNKLPESDRHTRMSMLFGFNLWKVKYVFEFNWTVGEYVLKQEQFGTSNEYYLVPVTDLTHVYFCLDILCCKSELS